MNALSWVMPAAVCGLITDEGVDTSYTVSCEEPVYVGTGEADRAAWIPAAFYARPDTDVCVRVLRAWKMRSQPALMSEFGAALQFFEGFGENWSALEGCLPYMDEWLPVSVYILVVERAEEMLADEPGEMPAFLRVMDRVGKFWSAAVTDGDRFDRPPIPFHVLLHFSENMEGPIAAMRSIASRAEIAIRV